MATSITLFPSKTSIEVTGADGSVSTQTLAVAATPDSTNRALHQYNLPEADSLHAAQSLPTLFPGLKLQNKSEVDIQHPAELISQYRPEEAQGDHLIIRSPGEEHRILTALSDSQLLKTFGKLTILAHEEPMYQNAQPAQETLAWLQGEGFELGKSKQGDPDWPTWHLTRNPLKNALDTLESENKGLASKLQSTEERLDHSNKQLAEAEKALQQEQAAHQDAVKSSEDFKQRLQQSKRQVEKLQAELGELRQHTEQLNSENQGLKGSLSAQASEAAASKQRIGELEIQLEKKSAELIGLRQQLELVTNNNQQLQEQLAGQGNTQSALKTLQERMDYLFGQNTLQLEQAANALGQHISHTAQHTAKELEAGLALQQQLGQDGAAITASDSSLPKSAALQLAKQLKNQTYDLIIELGSGGTTQFIAHTLKSARNTAPQADSQKKLTHYVEASDDDLPKRIISFEHNRTRHSEVSEQLKNRGLAGYVNLQFSPLVPYQYQGKEHLFYDCANRLQHLSQLLDGGQASILVLVNPQTDSAGPDVTVALPALLQFLSAHKLEIVFSEQEAVDIPSQWLNLMKERGLDHTEFKIFGTEPVQHLTVNP